MINSSFSPYNSVMAMLRGERPDKIPFTVYDDMLPQCDTERTLRNRGLCIVKRMTSYKVHHPNVKSTSFHYTDENGRALVRGIYSTPFGDLSTLTETVGSSWTHEFMFKTPDDYKALLYIIQDTYIEPDYYNPIRTVACLGEDFIVRDQIPLEPIQAIISSYMGTETFCYEWLDNRDEVLKLYAALVDMNRKTYNVIANGPLEFANYGGNVVPQIIGRENFKKYYIPNYNEAAEILHKKGKLIGSHLDADNTIIMDLVSETDLDYIEAYDPGISPKVEEACKSWPNKVLWLNWPSPWHLVSEEQAKIRTLDMIRQSTNSKGFIIGITEDVPEDRWKGLYVAIMDAIDEFQIG